ncbi:MAG: hypothetical protein OEZ25_01880 [Candidatus Bathyarchaeota archaeon]|nr:hypothetical protein [Candidatus Bathyarchaeota archaeon]
MAETKHTTVSIPKNSPIKSTNFSIVHPTDHTGATAPSSSTR